MKLFLFKILFYSIFLSSVLWIVDFFIQYGLRKSSYHEISKWNEVIQGSIDAEILFVGSSRALVHFDPRIIEKYTSKSSYNLGLDGSKFESQKLVLDLYLLHNEKPKILYWALDFGTFQKLEGVYRYEQFLPYLSDPKVKEILNLNKGMDLTFLDFPVCRFSVNPLLKYLGLIKNTAVVFQEPILIKGYRESNKVWDGMFDEFLMDNQGGVIEFLDSELFKKFLIVNQGLKKDGIEVRWVIPPYYTEAQLLIKNRETLINRFKSEGEKLNIACFDFTKDVMNSRKEYFYNGSHLNLNGVKIFLNKFVRTI